MRKQSIKGAVRTALAEDRRARKGQPMVHGVPTQDSFVNLGQRLGLGADNGMSTGSYGFNPVTRNRVLLEWAHRGSWVAGMAVDLIADDMTRRGVEFTTEMPPEDIQKIQHAAQRMDVWGQTNSTIKWSRLYGGSLGVMLVDGQDMKTPLRLETVGKDQFKGLLPLDRWMVEPALEDLVTDYGPHLGLPKYYRVGPSAPALRGMTVHHSRCAFRLEGVKLPYQQRLTENLWGISILERLFDRMVMFDSATTGAAQLVFKAYLRTLSIEGLRDIVAAGGDMMQGLQSFVEIMRRYQGQEGITLIDAKDKFEVQQTSAFASVGDVILQIGQQLSGALQIPLVRMFGQSPAGLNSSGESDLRTYYDGINARQVADIGDGVTTVYKLIAQSEGIDLPDDFAVEFRSLWDMTDKEKADVAKGTGEAVGAAMDGGLFGRKTALKELRQSSRRTGIFSNITQEQIESADDEVMPPLSEQAMDKAGFGPGVPDFAVGKDYGKRGALPGADSSKKLPGDEDGSGQDGKKKPVDAGARRRVQL